MLGCSASLGGCATEQIPNYGDPAQVAGGVGGGSSGTTTTGGDGGSGGSVACDPDPACAVSFATEIFPVLDTTAKCADSGLCHGNGSAPGNLDLTAGDAASYYDALVAYVIDGGGAYVVPCDPASSQILCNLKATDGTNPNGECGATMPVAKNDAPTLAQLKKIEDWIACGAPNN